ncbi:MAG: histidine kinase dimerization/phospho-acceptor domain-containing protein [Croceibacterium sp.]
MTSGGNPVQFDDRLHTVLHSRADSPGLARTQYRQLLDLLGSQQGETSPTLAPSMAEAGYARLQQLADELPATVQSAILREPGLRLRNPALIARLALGEPQAAAAAMATARLSDDEWLNLIPSLPLVARGFLRHRRDLPPGARATLQRLGVQDLVLPEPAEQARQREAQLPTAPPATADSQRGIGDLVRRIEEFRRTRSEVGASPRLPLAGLEDTEAQERPECFDFATDASGVVRWTDPAMAPLVVGMPLLAPGTLAPTLPDRAARRAAKQRQLLRHTRALLNGPAAIAGEWRIDAAPHFSADSGSFAGYRGRLRRPAPPMVTAQPKAHGEADRIRQVLHELRTPVNAIQGFAEIIQQQLFGAVPNEYRALSAAIAVDAARLLGGFEDLDRLARLESGAMDLPEGISDLASVLAGQLRRLDGVLRPRSAAIDLRGSGPLLVGLDGDDAALLAWRLLAALAGGLAPGETITISQSREGDRAVLEAELPLALDGQDDLFAGSPPAQPRAISAGMFGTGFALRLARAEAEAIGGSLERRGELLTLSLPILCQRPANDYQADEANGGTSAA